MFSCHQQCVKCSVMQVIEYDIARNIGRKNIWQFWTDLNIGVFNFGGVTMDYFTVHMMQ